MVEGCAFFDGSIDRVLVNLLGVSVVGVGMGVRLERRLEIEHHLRTSKNGLAWTWVAKRFQIYLYWIGLVLVRSSLFFVFARFSGSVDRGIGR